MKKITSIFGCLCTFAVLFGFLVESPAEVTTVSGRNQVTAADYYGSNDVRITQGNQVWITSNVTLANTFYISGNGWHDAEQFGPIRFAGGYSAAECPVISGNVILEGNARISTRNGATASYGIISGSISGDYRLEYNTMLSGGTLILAGTNSYGATAVTNGTLQIGNGGTSGTLGTGSVSLASGSALAFSRSDAVSLTNTVTGGSGTSIIQRGTGTLTVSTDVSAYGGTFSASSGILTWENNASVGNVMTSGTGTISWGSVTNVTGTVKIGSAVNYSDIVKTGVTFASNPLLVSGGVLDLNGISYDEAISKITLSGGKLTDSSGTSGIEVNGSRTINASVTLPVYLATDGGANTIIVEGANNFVLSGIVQNKSGFTSQKLIKSGSGTLTLTAANTYDGGTEIQEGTLVLDRIHGGSFLGNVSVAAGATFQQSMNGTSFVTGNKISGNGTWLIFSPDGNTSTVKDVALNAANMADLDGFTGTIAFQGQRVSVNWTDVGSSRTLEVRDSAQFWIGNAETTIQNPLIIAGNGWATNERRGAIRFQAGVNIIKSDESEMKMTVLSGPVTLSANARISPYGDTNKVYAMISGTLSGDYTLEVNGISADKINNRLILTGTNTYGATTVSNCTLQIGNIGKINGVMYDGTTGTLGTGATTVNSSAILSFNRSNQYDYASTLTNNGTFNIKSGTFAMKQAFSGSGTTNIAEGATLQTATITDVADTQVLTGSGTWLIQTADTSGYLGLNFTGKSLGGFTGTLAMQNWRTSTINWDSFSGHTVEVRDSAQLWIQNAVIGDLSDDSTTFRITGNGWKGETNENRGAIRFNTYWDSANPTAMQLLKANVEIVDAAKIMLYSDGKSNHSAMSGTISGGTMNVSAQNASDCLILLGENTYGATNISNIVLQIGCEGTLNSTVYDGTSGTLGTGKVTVASEAVLDIHRDTYVLNNELENSGTFRISRGVTTLTKGISGGTAGVITILKGASLVAAPVEDAEITSRLTGAGTFEKTGSKTLTLSNLSTSTPRFDGKIHVKEGTLNISYGAAYDYPAENHPLGTELRIDAGAAVNLKKAHLLGWNGSEMTTPVIAGTLDLGNDQFIGDIVMNGGLLKDGNNKTGHRVRGDISTTENSGTSTITAQLNFITSGGTGEGIKAFNADGTHTFNIAAGSTLDFQGILAAWSTSGTVPLVKTGAGTLLLSGKKNTYSQTMDVQDGILEIAGNYNGNITLNGGTLAGNGTVQGTVTMNGGKSAIEATPAGKTGTLTLSNALNLNGTLLADLGGSAAGTYDQIVTTGNLSIVPGSSVVLTLVDDYMPGAEDVGLTHWDLLTGQAGDLTGYDLSQLTISGPALDAVGLSWMLGISEDGSTLYAALGTPEPAAWCLLLLGALGIFGFMRKRRG